MQVVKKYSHLHGEEYLLVHQPALYAEVLAVIESLDASLYLTKESKEKRKVGTMLYSPMAINSAFAEAFSQRGWDSVTRRFYVSDNYRVVKAIEPLSYAEQREYLITHDEPLIVSYNQTDFVKGKVAVEVQLGKYFAVTYDLFVKHLSFYTGDIIDVGIEIVPSKELQQQMSSGVPFYEKEVHNVLRHGRTTPPVPLVIIGVGP